MMDHESLYTPAQQPQPVSRRKWLVIAVVAILLILALVFSLLGRSKDSLKRQQFSLSRSSLAQNLNFPKLEGDDIYAYNGAAFYKLSANDPKNVTVLNAGYRLPTPSNLYWADANGALMTFKYSYYNTAVEQALRAAGQTINQASQRYTWYLDFATGKLKLASESPIDPDSVVYSSKEKGFYFASEPSAADRTTDSALLFYPIDSGRTQTVSDKLGITDIQASGVCLDQKVCFMGRERDNPITRKLFGIDAGNKISVLLDSGGRMFATNNPNYYLTSERGQDPYGGKDGESQQENADYSDDSVFFQDIQTKTKSKLDFTVGGYTQLFTLFTSPEAFYIFDSSADTPEGDDNTSKTYRTGTINSSGDTVSTTFPLQYLDGSSYKGKVTDIIPGADKALLTDVMGSKVMGFGPPQTFKEILAGNYQTASNTIDTCAKESGAKDKQYYADGSNFTVSFLDDTDMAKHVSTFSACIAKAAPDTLVGYNYTFIGVNDEGRITTD